MRRSNTQALFIHRTLVAALFNYFGLPLQTLMAQAPLKIKAVTSQNYPVPDAGLKMNPILN
jgi:hypothetical protein